MGSCFNCKHLLNCGACKACGTNFDKYEPIADESEENALEKRIKELEKLIEKIKIELQEYGLFLCQECLSVYINYFAEDGGVWNDEAPIICPNCAEKIGWFCDCGVVEDFVLNGERCHSCGRSRKEMESKNGNA